MINETTRWLSGLSLFFLIFGYLAKKYPHILIKIPGRKRLWLTGGGLKFTNATELFGKEGAIKIQRRQSKVAFAVSAFFAYLAIGSLVLSILGKN